MKTMKPRKIALAGTVVAAVALVGCLGCAAQTQTADTGAAQEPVQQEQPGQETAAPEKVAKKTLAEWVAAYPNEGNTYMEAKMSHTYDAFAGASQQAFGGEDAAVACAACHAREDFQTIYNEQGAVILDKNASDYEMEWSNCTNCHVGDPGEGNVEGGNATATLLPRALRRCSLLRTMYAASATPCSRVRPILRTRTKGSTNTSMASSPKRCFVP